MANYRKIKRRIEIILFPVMIAVVLVLSIVTTFYMITPVQKIAIRSAIRIFKLPITINYDRLHVGINFLNVDNLDMSITGDDADISITADSIRANFTIRNRQLYVATFHRPIIRITEKAGDDDGDNMPDFDIPDFQIDKLRIIDGMFSFNDFVIGDIGYFGALTSAGSGIVIQPDSLGGYLHGRGRINYVNGRIMLDEGVHVDVDARLARSNITGKGSITNMDPKEWNFAVEANPADLVEIDSILDLGFLEGYGKAKIDLAGKGETVSGYIFIDGEIFTIPAKNVSGYIDFRESRLEISSLKGSVWGATMDGNLKMVFPPEDDTTQPIEMIIEGYARNLDLNAFMEAGEDLPTNLNGRARVVGELLDTIVTMTVHGNLGRSEIFDIAFDTASGSLYICPDSVNFYPGFEVLRGGNYLTMNGVIVFDREIFIQFGLWAPNLANITSIAGMESTITGRARMENAQILGEIEHPILSFDIVSDELATGPVNHDRFLAQATIYDFIESPRGDIYIESEGEFSGITYDSLITQVELHGNRYYIKPFLLWGDSISAKGVAEIVAVEDSIGIRAEGFELEIYDHPVTLESTFVVSIMGETIESTPLYAGIFGGDIIVNRLVGDRDEITIGAKLNGLSAQKASEFLPFESIFGKLSGEFFINMPYDLKGAVGQYEMFLDELSINNLDFTRAEVLGNIRDGVVEVEPVIIGRETEQYFIRGWIDPTTENIPFDFEANIHGTRAGLLASFVDEIDSMVGPFDMKINMKGSKDSLYADGSFTWNSGILGLKSMADPVESLYLDLQLTGNEIVIDSASGVVGALPVEEKSLWARIVRFFRKEKVKYGHFGVRGKIDISEPTSPDMDISFTARDLPLNFPEEGLFLRNNADITIEGAQPVAIEGRIKINKVNLVKLETEGGDGGALDSLPVELNVLVEIPGNAWILTDILDAEIGGEINVMTEQSALALYGEMEVLRGKAFFLGRTFKITRGRIYFESFKGINPRLDIEAISRAGEVDIVLQITGALEEPQINLFAQDRAGNRMQAYSQGDVFSLLALNVEGEGIQTSAIEERVPQVIQGYLTREVEDVARRTLGVETFEFEPSDQDVFDLTQAKVTIGKYLTDRIYLTYTRSLSFDEQSSDIINLEYILSDHITMHAGRSAGVETRDEYKLELQFRWEY